MTGLVATTSAWLKLPTRLMLRNSLNAMGWRWLISRNLHARWFGLPVGSDLYKATDGPLPEGTGAESSMSVSARIQVSALYILQGLACAKGFDMVPCHACWWSPKGPSMDQPKEGVSTETHTCTHQAMV